MQKMHSRVMFFAGKKVKISENIFEFIDKFTWKWFFIFLKLTS